MANSKMTLNAAWSMAVGGMVGGGIFSVLGVIISSAGQWAWLSFLIAGIIALISANSYSALSTKYNEAGGVFSFLRQINKKGFAASLAWVLVLGYVLTLSVYAFTFGHYVAYIFDAGGWLPRVLAIAIIGFLTFINLRGVGDASRLEIITVYGKLLVLLGLAIFGLMEWAPEQLTAGITPKPWHAAIVGAGTIFIAYEGFQLLSYDYDDIENPKRNMPRATIWAVLAVIVIYLLVTLGTTMIVGAETLVQQKEVALAVAGKKILGITGLIIVTVAAAFSTGSAINATLFSTARLMKSVAEKKDLPHVFTKENKKNIPYNSLLAIAGIAAILAVIGSLNSLVDAASIIFLFTFGTVNFLAFMQAIKFKWFSLAGAVACGLAIIADIIEQIGRAPWAIGILLFITACIFIFRPYVVRKLL